MSLSTINGQDGTADVSINGTSYACIFTEHEFETNTAQVDATTFCTETASVYEPGETMHFFRFAGLLKKGGSAAGPLLPLPQNVPIVQTFSTGCSLSYNGNFERGLVRRTVKSNGILAAQGRATGAIVKSWILV